VPIQIQMSYLAQFKYALETANPIREPPYWHILDESRSKRRIKVVAKTQKSKHTDTVRDAP